MKGNKIKVICEECGYVRYMKREDVFSPHFNKAIAIEVKVEVCNGCI